MTRQWMPEDISMQLDVEQWRSMNILTDDERTMVLRNIGYFSTASSFMADNIVLTAYKHITNPECRQYLLRQAYETSIHTDAFIQCCDTLGLDPDEIYSMHQNIETIKAKDDFVAKFAVPLKDPKFSITSTKGIQQFVLNLVGNYVVMEGLFFYTSFAMMLMLRRRDKMAKEICIENPKVWTPAFKSEIIDMIKEAVDLEKEYVSEACPHGLMGIDAVLFSQYIDYIADTRLEQIGLPKLFQQVNPFKWLSQSVSMKDKGVFNSSHEYHTSDVKW